MSCLIFDFVYFVVVSLVAGFTEKLQANRLGSGWSFDWGESLLSLLLISNCLIGLACGDSIGVSFSIGFASVSLKINSM